MLKALCRNAIKSFSIGMTLILASGCTLVKPDPLPTIPPLGSSSAPIEIPVPSWTPSGRWRGLSSTCPTISHELPGLSGLAGEGKPADGYQKLSTGLAASCGWQRKGEEYPNIHVLIRMYWRDYDQTVVQQAIEYLKEARNDAEEKALKDPLVKPPQDVPGVGDEAFLTLYPGDMRISLRARSENAVIFANIWLKDDWDYDDRRRIELVSAQRSNIIALMVDVLDDLR